jgi:hypothetical protein
MQLAQAAIALLMDPARMDRLGRNALQRMRATGWDNVAIAHARTFALRTRSTDRLSFQWPAVSLDHLQRMTDRIGMVQFCDISEPDVRSGHTLDDNARALIALCIHAGNADGIGQDRALAARYVDYIVHCQQANGRFLNYADVIPEVWMGDIDNMEQNVGFESFRQRRTKRSDKLWWKLSDESYCVGNQCTLSGWQLQTAHCSVERSKEAIFNEHISLRELTHQG